MAELFFGACSTTHTHRHTPLLDFWNLLAFHSDRLKWLTKDSLTKGANQWPQSAEERWWHILRFVTVYNPHQAFYRYYALHRGIITNTLPQCMESFLSFYMSFILGGSIFYMQGFTYQKIIIKIRCFPSLNISSIQLQMYNNKWPIKPCRCYLTKN